MSLKAGAERSAAKSPFRIGFESKNNKWESGKRVFRFPLFHASSGLWECGNRSGDFQGRGETKGNLVLVFLVLHGPSFPQPSSFFTHSVCDASGETVFVWLAAFRPLPVYRTAA